MKYILVVANLALLVLGAAGRPLEAQQAERWDPRGAELKRDELDSLLARLDRAAQSGAYSQSLRRRSQAEAAMLRERLRDGDFQAGDRVFLRVDNEPTLSDTFVVLSGRMLALPPPIAGDIPLSGVLRSELAAFLTTRIAKYVRDPVVHVRSLVRIAVVGGAAGPGFFTVPADMPLPDILMLAGGWSPQANLEDMRVDRGTERLWEGEALQVAMREGRTVDQLSLRAGDQITIPERGRGTNVGELARTIGAVVSIPIAIFGLVQLFR